MTFMMAYFICGMVPVFYYFNMVRANVRLKEIDPGTPFPLHAALTFLPMIPLCLGFISGLFPDNVYRSSQDANNVPYFILTGGILGVVLYGAAAVRKTRNAKGATTRQGGAWIMAVLASAYLAFTAVDHLVFFADKEASGIMSSDLSKAAGIECAAPYLIVKKVERAFQYRCRINLQLGHQFGQPFLPWPSYQEGTSEELVHVIEKLEAAARKQGQ